MKKIILLFTVSMTLCIVSCKKDRTCTCTNKDSTGTATEKIVFHKVSNKTAEADCVNQTMIGDDGTGPSTLIFTCKLD